MPLVTSTEMLLAAQQNHYAVGAFNIETMEMAQAVIAAAEEAKAPVILQTTPGTLQYASPAVFCGIVAALSQNTTIPIALHLDHGSGFALASEALQAGYTSVMIDGSQLPFAENVAVTRQVVEAAAAYGVPVEAELGKIGGKEDDVAASGSQYTDPEEARAFVSQTGVRSLAVAIGTAHGFYTGTPVLALARLTALRHAVDVPLVLHGASGLSDSDILSCVQRGICKVNFATELRVAFTDGIKEALSQNPSAYDPKAYGKIARQHVFNLTLSKMQCLGCIGKGA